MQQIGKFDEKINVIPNNLERYMAIMLGKYLVFIDSLQFMNSSLENLANNLNLDSFKYTKEEFGDEKYKMMIRKGVYPYEYMDSWDRFKEKKLPSKECFYSSLKEENISDEDFEHAQKIWKAFKMKTLGEYHDLYLKTDVLLLADVFENFRQVCNQYYGLDPCHYFSSPGLSWDALLKMTKICLELVTDIDMYQFIEKGLFGGISYISKRYAKANNKYQESYNPKKKSRYIMYLDANNLYGWAMSQKLPTGGFKWLTKEQIKKLDSTKDSKKGWFYEVDLEYPKELHDLHNDYPLAPEKMEITEDMLSPYCKAIQKKFNISTGGVKKLVTTLRDKKNYVVHYKNLQLYVSLGMKIKKIHRVLEFDQSAWMKPYIEFNTNKRKEAKNDFEKDFFKLMNNSVYGKTMENLRKRCNVRLVTSKQEMKRLVSKPS